MSKVFEQVVMDVSPWPSGQGFSGASAWWETVMGKSDRQKLDHLFGIALLDPELCEKLLTRRDDALLMPFGFSDEVRHWLKTIKALTLPELAEAILNGPEIEGLRTAA